MAGAEEQRSQYPRKICDQRWLLGSWDCLALRVVDNRVTKQKDASASQGQDRSALEE